jgi:hypothetical protein
MHHLLSAPSRRGRAGAIGLSAIVLALALAGNASAAISTYTAPLPFATDTATGYTPATLIDFENTGRKLADAPWTATGSIGAGGGPKVVTGTGLWSTSAGAFLGSGDTANLGQFTGGDALSFHFTQAVDAFGLYVIAGSDILPGDFTLSANGHQVSNAALSQALTDGQGSYAFFLGLRAGAPGEGFSDIRLQSTSFFYLFAVDDVRSAHLSPVPEAQTWALALAGLLGVSGMWGLKALRARRAV